MEQYYPAAALILRVDVQQRTFFVVSFPVRNEKENSGFSSVVYKPQNIQQFLSGEGDFYSRNENLFKLLIEIVSSEGVSSDYVDSKDGKMSLFRHVEAKKQTITGFGMGLGNYFKTRSKELFHVIICKVFLNYNLLKYVEFL